MKSMETTVGSQEVAGADFRSRCQHKTFGPSGHNMQAIADIIIRPRKRAD